MSLFECSKCHVIENTALSNFFWDVGHDNKPALCSQCDPEIGVWHGRFERKPAAELRKTHPEEFKITDGMIKKYNG